MHVCLSAAIPSPSMIHRKGGRPETIKADIVAMVRAAKSTLLN